MFKVIDKTNGNEREFETRAEAEDTMEMMEEDFGHECELQPVETDGGEVQDTPAKGTPMVITRPESESDTVDVPTQTPTDFDETADLPDEPRIDEDPLNYLPSHFVDDIQGVPAINRKGYAVLAAHYGIGVKAEPVVRASETDREFAEFQAVATTEDGVEYSGFGSAHVDRMDGDDEFLLNELAETRACKRALALATGVGVVSAEEMTNSL